MTVIEEFKWRGMLAGTSEGLLEAIAHQKVTAYIGFDPSASSLHVGSLLPIMGLVRLQRYGHTPIAVVGGGTGMIGDPSGKSRERMLLSEEEIEHNLAGIKEQLSHFLDFDAVPNPARIVNNAEWLRSVGMLDFLRDVGKYFTVNYMLSKESVRRRIEQAEGISFTEFAYMLLQAYDFLMLFDRYHCTLQLGGTDQWGNIVAGAELIRRLRGEKAYACVFPLVTTSSGVKFGKSEAGSVWLDPKRTSPFQFYQFWYNTDDRDAVTYLKYFTLLDQGEIQDLEVATVGAPGKRIGQERLAREVTRIVHGEVAMHRAAHASQRLFSGDFAGATAREILDMFADVPSSILERARFTGDGLPIVELVKACGYATSNGDARRLIEAGGIYLNGRRVSDARKMVELSSFIEGQILVVRKGAHEYHLIHAV